MRAVLFGATRGIGRALGRGLARRGERLFLLGRDAADLARSARDLEIHGAPAPVGTAHCDLEAPDTFAPALDRARKALGGGFDTAVLSAGLFATQERLERDPELLRQLLTVDFVHSVAFCETARRHLLEQGGGTLCAFSSVAGERARKPVLLYGAAKAGLSHYLQGLDHKYRAAGLRTICVKPGFVKTSMTAGLEPPPFAAEPDEVVGAVLQAIDRGNPVVYAPRVWRLVAGMIRLLPRAVMRRVDF